MSNKHTPGPWHITAPQLDGAIAVCDTHPCVIAFATVEADARLIAAAPELLAALEAFLNGDPSVTHQIVTYDDARRAVAKAKGEL